MNQKTNDSPPLVGIESVVSTTPRATNVAVLDPYETFVATKYFASLNGIRCMCCLAVIKEHAGWRPTSPRIADLGFLGVDLFFVISGFLIVTLLIRERKRRGTINLKDFYARRTLRIFPIYYLLIFMVFLGYLAVSPWYPNGLRYYFWGFLVLLTYTQDLIPANLGPFFHCWSLAMEEQFYLLWPTVEKYINAAGRRLMLVAALCISQIVNFGLLDGVIARIYGSPSAVSMPIFEVTFTPILLGVVLAYLLSDRDTFMILYRLVGYRWSPFVLLGLVVMIAELSPPNLGGWARLSLQSNLVLLLTSLVIREDHFARAILTFPWIARLGVISYGLYLYHTWVLWGLGFILGRLKLTAVSPPVMFLLVTAGTILVAELSFRIIEQPLLRVKERYSHN